MDVLSLISRCIRNSSRRQLREDYEELLARAEAQEDAAIALADRARAARRAARAERRAAALRRRVALGESGILPADAPRPVPTMEA